jgi:anaerobic glycerol-3-phosphate dehydrogenase
VVATTAEQPFDQQLGNGGSTWLHGQLIARAPFGTAGVAVNKAFSPRASAVRYRENAV